MAAKPRVFDFNAAIVRRPANSVVNGLRAVDRGAPSVAGVRAEHDAYVAALERAGVVVTVLDPREDFPDSIFVEDPALVFGEAAILLRPGVASRVGEVDAIAPVLRERFPRVLELKHGFVDGGDVLVTPDRVMIGLSARTDQRGAEELIGLLERIDRRGEIFHTPEGVLHFKSDCALVDEGTILSTARLAASGAFDDYRVIVTPEGEEGAANALRVNGTLFVGADFPGTIDLLRKAGFAVEQLATGEIAKIDAGLSCMSLRWFDGAATS
jgi:dimethylargininase